MNVEFLDELIELVLKIKSKEEMKEFLFGLLTKTELSEIPTRVQIIKMLRKGFPHHRIAEKLGVGVATVSRGSKELKKGRFSNIE